MTCFRIVLSDWTDCLATWTHPSQSWFAFKNLCFKKEISPSFYVYTQLPIWKPGTFIPTTITSCTTILKMQYLRGSVLDGEHWLVVLLVWSALIGSALKLMGWIWLHGYWLISMVTSTCKTCKTFIHGMTLDLHTWYMTFELEPWYDLYDLSGKQSDLSEMLRKHTWSTDRHSS